MLKPNVVIIVAALKPALGIGYKGKMPWRLRKEIRYFKDVTTKQRNQILVMLLLWEERRGNPYHRSLDLFQID